MCKQNLSYSLSVHEFGRIKRRNSTVHNLLTFLLSNNNVRAISGKTRGWLNKISCFLLWQLKTWRERGNDRVAFPCWLLSSTFRALSEEVAPRPWIDTTIIWSRNLPEHQVLFFQISCANNFHNLFSHSMKKHGLFEARTLFSALSVAFLMHSWLLATPSLTAAEHRADLCRKLFTGIPKSFFLWAILQLVIAYGYWGLLLPLWIPLYLLPLIFICHFITQSFSIQPDKKVPNLDSFSTYFST